ncbi:hypothetical protein LSM04_009345 [Trypanosoma melophagium]|uniref:uncharacterized protein n=1 Tax=Trypanosoma melophagium TaxID=715481 RepID=UPI00351A9A54|nr:hypothetical protein LSM04_009345 [Trypanosoma melophagium]
MRRFYRLGCRQTWGPLSVNTMIHFSNTFDQSGTFTVNDRNCFLSNTSIGTHEMKINPFFSNVVSDLQLLQKKWMREFRICVTSNSTLIIEALNANETHSWTPVATLDAARWPWDIVKTVDVVLGPNTNTTNTTNTKTNTSTMNITEGCGVTVIDLHDRAEDVAVAQRVLTERYPKLRLHIDHSKGTDLQGTLTHSVSVSLQSRSHGTDLSPEETAVKESFVGESIGLGFSQTVRRALREAFQSSGIPLPSRHTDRDKGKSEMDIYLDIIRNALNEDITVISRILNDEQIRISVQSCGGRQINVLDGRRDDALSIVLACVEKAAENVNSIATEEARKRIADHPVVLALPQKGIRPKEILRRLLMHTYGLIEERVHIITSQGNDVTFTTTIDTELSWGYQTPSKGTPVVITIARAAGVNKKSAEELACVTAIQRCFPRIFEEQLSYHMYVKEILQSTKATSKESICPHISKGLLAQLRWAARCEKKKIVFDTVQLFPNSENEELGIRTTRALWATQLFFTDDKGNRQLICLALDPKKSISEQKAVAATLWKCFKDVCNEGVQYAIERGLINKDGDVTPCEGISTSTETITKNDYEIAAESDPFIPNLQLLPSQPISVPYRQSLLSVFRRGVQLYVELMNERSCYNTNGNHICEKSIDNWKLVEHTEKVEANGHFKAQLFIRNTTNNSNNIDNDVVVVGDKMSGERLFGEVFYSTTAIGAIFNAFKSLFDEGGLIARSAKEDIQIKEIFSDTIRRVASFPSLPRELPSPTPLETVAQCVMIKYGLATELHITGGGKVVNVQLFGRSPSSLSCDSSQGQNRFFLGHGRGSSLLKSVVSCCRHTFNTHIRHDDDLPGTTAVESLKSGSVQVMLRAGSLLAAQVEAVRNELLENKAVSASASIFVGVDIQPSGSNILYEAKLYVADEMRVVELDRSSPTSDLIASLWNLTCSVVREMGGSTLDVDSVQRKYCGPTHYIALQQLLEDIYGLTLVEETLIKDQNWHSHLSIRISEDLYYTVGYSVSTKKKEAVEMSAMKALDRCFGTVSKSMSPQIGVSVLTTKTTATSVEEQKYCGFIYRRLGEREEFFK